MSLQPEHPAASAAAVGTVCADKRCATLLAIDAEICDECGGARLQSLQEMRALLCGWAGTRPVVFAVPSAGPSIVGRSPAAGPVPDVDLRRFPGSGVVHRRHASIEQAHGEWQVTHLGTNPLVVTDGERVVLEHGASARLRPGSLLQVGDVVLLFVLRDSP